MLKRYEDALAGLEERGRLRKLALPAGYDFTSNDYLGLADSPALQDAVRAASRTWRRCRRGRLAAVARQRYRARNPGGGGGGLFRRRDGPLFQQRLLCELSRCSRRCLSAAILSSTMRSFMRALMTACGRAGPSGRKPRITTRTPSRTRSAPGARAAARAAPGSRSKASTAWTATARRSKTWPPWPIAMTPCWSSTRRTPRACSAPMAAVSAHGWKGGRMSSRCTLAARRLARRALSSACRKSCATSS